MLLISFGWHSLPQCWYGNTLLPSIKSLNKIRPHRSPIHIMKILRVRSSKHAYHFKCVDDPVIFDWFNQKNQGIFLKQNRWSSVILSALHTWYSITHTVIPPIYQISQISLFYKSNIARSNPISGFIIFNRIHRTKNLTLYNRTTVFTETVSSINLRYCIVHTHILIFSHSQD